MASDTFYNALFKIMWEMEIDIFSEVEKTCALVADLAPKCRKERSNLVVMYRCDAMDYIEMAVSKPEKSQIYLKKAVKTLVENADMDVSSAVKSVNSVAALWDTFSEIEEKEGMLEDIGGRYAINKKQESEFETDDMGGDDEMLFVESTDEEDTEDDFEEEEMDEGTENKLSFVKNFALFWCKGDEEDGRPHMYASVVGWIMMLSSLLLGILMIADIAAGDKFVVPVFVFTFVLLTSKRIYMYDSSARYSLLVMAFYIIAMLKSIFLENSSISYLCVPFMAVVLIVLNNGRISSFFDSNKKKSVPAYLLICIFSSIITFGAYAIQNMVAIP